MFGKNNLRIATTLALAGAFSGLLRPARAADPPVGAVPAPASSVMAAEPPWQRTAFRLALVASGVSLAAGVGYRIAYQRRIDAFNSHMKPWCSRGSDGNGGPACNALLDRSRSPHRWSNLAFGMTGALAVGAMVMLLTEPDSAPTETSDRSSRRRLQLACAPGLGLNASCAVTF